MPYLKTLDPSPLPLPFIPGPVFRFLPLYINYSRERMNLGGVLERGGVMKYLRSAVDNANEKAQLLWL